MRNSVVFCAKSSVACSVDVFPQTAEIWKPVVDKHNLDAQFEHDFVPVAQP